MPPSTDTANIAQRTTARIRLAFTGALAVLKLSPSEEAFFREGEQLANVSDVPDVPDVSEDAGPAQPTRWRALVGWLRGDRPRRADRRHDAE
jgi:hypothetical protein